MKNSLLINHNNAIKNNFQGITPLSRMERRIKEGKRKEKSIYEVNKNSKRTVTKDDI